MPKAGSRSDAAIPLLESIVELCGTFARDASEKANIAAVEVLRRYFVAEAAGLFYVDGLGRYRFCPAGAGLPISLSEERWKSCLDRIPDAPS
ncbi:MAG: hypothetical protein Q8M76_16045, partial [Spirochaetaceae bacterium]|nr:hypothetical protein [Spirochaetaceae bacterium]